MITHGVIQSYIGMVFGFILALSIVYVGYQSILAGQVGTGTVMILGTLVSLVGAFIYGRQKRDAELERKRDP